MKTILIWLYHPVRIPPTSQKDSKYPPDLLIVNASKRLPIPSPEHDEILVWFTSWLLALFPEFNFSEILVFEGFELFLHIRSESSKDTPIMGPNR